MYISEKAKKIKMFIMDVDGVLTDGKITYTSSGEEIKSFNVKDGLGIVLLHIANIKTAIITSRSSSILERRVKELKISILYQGEKKKLKAVEEILQKHNLQYDDIAYIGDDIIDLPVMEKVGLPIAVNDAPDIVKKTALYITEKKGGEGAVREAIDFILTSKGVYEDVIKEFLYGKR